MRCPRCGAHNDDSWNVCYRCGNILAGASPQRPVPNQRPHHSPSGDHHNPAYGQHHSPAGNNRTPAYGYPQRPAAPSGHHQSPRPASPSQGRNPQAYIPRGFSELQQQGMLWHAIQIYIWLWVGLGFNCLAAIYYGFSFSITLLASGGSSYVRNSSIVGILYALILLGEGGAAVFVRFQLAGFKQKAPLYLWILNIADAGAMLLKDVILIALTASYIKRFYRPNLFEYIGIGTYVDFVLLLGDIALIVWHFLYYQKRRHMFVY